MIRLALALEGFFVLLGLRGRVLPPCLTRVIVCNDPTDGGQNFLHCRLRSALGAAHD